MGLNICTCVYTHDHIKYNTVSPNRLLKCNQSSGYPNVFTCIFNNVFVHHLKYLLNTLIFAHLLIINIASLITIGFFFLFVIGMLNMFWMLIFCLFYTIKIYFPVCGLYFNFDCFLIFSKTCDFNIESFISILFYSLVTYSLSQSLIIFSVYFKSV